MHDQLVDSLVHTRNEAADDLLLEGLRVGTEIEQSIVLNALIARKTIRGLSGILENYQQLPQRLQLTVLENIRTLHHALRECGRSERVELRLAAMKLIAISRQGKLAYVLSENLHDAREELSKAAVEAIVALARWVTTTTHKLQKEYKIKHGEAAEEAALETSATVDFGAMYRDLIDQRPEIETAVARALDGHRGKQTQDLLRAALLLSDWPASKTLAILQTPKHGGQNLMVRKLQQTPDAEHVEAFLLSGSHGGLRQHFGTVFSHISEAAVLDGILRKTHWLKDQQLQLCMHQVVRGLWWQENDLMRDAERHDPAEACKIAEWLTVSGMHDVVQDERFARLADRAKDRVGGRLTLLRVAIRRKRGTSAQFLKRMLSDPDERLMRMAAREMIRRRPTDYENILLQMMTNAPESVRRVISRSIGQAGFENYWMRFDRLDRPTRKQAGRAMMKMLPDATQRLARRLAAGPVDERLKALQMTHELGLAEALREPLVALSNHPHPKVRSKAVSVLGELQSDEVDVLMDRVLSDTDPRVRANAIEVLESRPSAQFVPLLAMKAKSNHNRERANALKALNKMKVGNIGPPLLAMLRDQRPEHRISAMWALRQMGWWKLLQEVGRLAKEDDNLRVRRYAIAVLRGVVDMAQNLDVKAG